MSPDRESLLDSLREMFSPGSSLGGDAISLGVREHPDGAVVMARLANDDHLYGIPVSFAGTRTDFYYTRFAVADDDEWLDSVSVGMLVFFGTGFRYSGRRTLVEDYIELSPHGGWPLDDRFHVSATGPDDAYPIVSASALSAVGLDTSTATTAWSDGRLLTWVRAYENNSAGSPYVGHAVVVWEPGSRDERVARLAHVEVTAEVPVTVLVDLAHRAAHLAAADGARTVITDHPLPELALVGFTTDPSHRTGERSVDTSFLDADPDGAARLLAASVLVPGRWGQNRDIAGRYLPSTRVGRWWHRLRHPRTGRPPRTRIRVWTPPEQEGREPAP